MNNIMANVLPRSLSIFSIALVKSVLS